MAQPAVSFEGVTLGYGPRRVWSELSLQVSPGSFLAILGPNGAGKTSLLKAILGLVAPTAGRIDVLGAPPRRGAPAIGYIPQHQSFDRDLPLRGRDLVRMGVDGHRWGIGLPDPAVSARVTRAIASVSAERYANGPIGRLSGGELQRLRIAQALVGEPRLLLCDEPLASLDLHHQLEITDLIAAWRRDTGGTVLFVTHYVNPVLHRVDRVVFVVNGRWAEGTPDEVLTSERISDLYGSAVDVLRVHGRVLVVGESTQAGLTLDEPHPMPEPTLVGHPADRPEP